MAPSSSKLAPVGSFSQKEAILKATFQTFPPAICFWLSSRKPQDNGKAEEGDQQSRRAFEVPLNPGNAQDEDSYKQYIYCFEDGTPEDWCSLRVELDDLFSAMAITEDIDKQHNIWRSLLKGKAKDRFTALHNAMSVEESAKTDPARRLSKGQILRKALNSLARKIFPDWQYAVRQQKRYLQHGLSMGSMEPEAFVDRVQKMNQYIKYFPSEQPLVAPELLSDEDVKDIIGQAVPLEWHILMMSQGKRIDTFTSVEEAVAYFKQLRQADVLRDRLGLSNVTSSGPTKKRVADTQGGRPTTKNALKLCPHCGKMGTHTPQECRSNPANKKGKGNRPAPASDFNRQVYNMLKKKAPPGSTSNAMKATEEPPYEDTSQEDIDAFLDQLKA